MASTTLPNLSIQNGWVKGEDDWNTGMDANLLKIDTLLQGSVKDYTLSTPPGSPASGDRYVVATGGTGAWNGQDGKLAVYVNSSWTFYTPGNGWLIKDINSGRLIGYNGSAWVLDPLGDRAYADTTISAAVANTTDVVERLTHFQNSTDSTSALFTQNGYNQIAGNSVNLTQTIANAVTGYQKAAGAAWLVAGTTSANYVAAVIRGGLAFSNAFGNVWSTGATIQTILYGSLMGYLPSGSNDIEYRFGLFYDGYHLNNNVGGDPAYALDPFASVDSGPNDGAAAYFYVDKNSGNWFCKSGSDTNTENTDTGVAAAVNILRAFRVKVGTTGAVQFWIDGTLVATHSGNGVITSGKQLSEAVVTMHSGSVSSGSNHGWMIASIGFRANLPSSRTGFSYV